MNNFRAGTGSSRIYQHGSNWPTQRHDRIANRRRHSSRYYGGRDTSSSAHRSNRRVYWPAYPANRWEPRLLGQEYGYSWQKRPCGQNRLVAPVAAGHGPVLDRHRPARYRPFAQQPGEWQRGRPPASLNRLLTTLVSNSWNELSMAVNDLKERVCFCIESPTRSFSAVVSMFLYAGSTAVLASGALGTIIVALPVLGITSFPFWLAALTLGGSAAAGGMMGLYYASEGRPVMPAHTHWSDILSRTLYWRRLNAYRT